MGFFSGFRRRIKKLIPKEVRPFIPYIAAGFSGPIGAKLGMSALAPMYQKALIAGGTKFLSDDEAKLKDVGITAALAAAPTALSEFGTPATTAPGANKTIMDSIRGGAAKLGQAAADKPFTTLATQAGVDYGIKAAELNKEALERYNAELAAQGIDDKAGRRAAIRAIYSNTGTWDMNEVDDMLDTYGYKSGGRVGYADGGMSDIEKKIQIMREAGMTEKQIVEYLQGRMGDISQEAMMFEDAYSPITNMEEGMPKELAIMQLEEALSTPGMENVGIRSVIDIVDKAADKEQLDNSLRKLERDVIDYDAPPSDFELKVRKLGLKNGGRIGLKDGGDFNYDEFQKMLDISKEGLDSLEEDEEAMPIRELRLARGGIADINMEEQIDTPSGDMMMDENIKMASDPSPMDELNSLSLMLYRKPLDELSEDEYENLKDFAGQTSLKPGLIDEYRNYKMGQEDAGQPVLSPRDYFEMEFGAARIGVADGGMMASMDMDVPIQDLAEEFEITFGRPANSLDELKDFYKQKYEFNGDVSMMERSQRTMAAQGGLMSMGGNEMDLRGGGFVPMGAKERADDVPARLSKNEFVMTADAVRGAGGGSVQKGADLMYDQMKTLEAKA